jgi:hypothetical protein
LHRAELLADVELEGQLVQRAQRPRVDGAAHPADPLAVRAGQLRRRQVAQRRAGRRLHAEELGQGEDALPTALVDHVGAAGERPLEDEAVDPVRVPGRVRRRHRAAVGRAEQLEPVDAEALHDRLDVGDEAVEGQLGSAVREPVAAHVVPDQAAVPGDRLEEPPEGLLLPQQLQVAHPAPYVEERGPRARGAGGDRHPVGRRDEADRW